MNEHETTLPNPQSLPETPAPIKRARPSRAKPKTLEPIREIVESVPHYIDPEETRRRELRAKQEAEKRYDHEMVTGKFLFNECPGGELKFPFLKYRGDQLVHYTMQHDKVYTVPRMVARHLNDNCWYPEYQHNMDNGKAVDATKMYITTKIHRVNFIPLDFSADAGYPGRNSIYQVSYTDPSQYLGR